MPLELYNKKRDFKKTAEPKGVKKKTRSGFSYLIQKHAASHLHYDFRLELNGVLLSWAVPKGPSLDPTVKRLAMHVEDHPVNYGGFEGTIPQGEYGGGTVMLWDRGTWEPLEDPVAGMKSGMLKFLLHGERLKGKWALIQMNGPRNESGKSWLLVKEKDEEVKPESKFIITDKFTKSVASNRTMDEIAGGDREWGPKGERKKKAAPKSITKTASKKTAVVAPRARATKRAPAKNKKTGGGAGPTQKKTTSTKKKSGKKLSADDAPGAKPAPLLRDLSPQLAMLVDQPPTGEGWIHELKFDGYRMFLVVDGKSVQLITARKGIEWTHKFSALCNTAKALLPNSAVIDGEAVVLKADGSTSFQGLQNALSGDVPAPIHYFAFDLIYLNGMDLRGVPLGTRKELLRHLLSETDFGNDNIRFGAHIDGHGNDVLAESCRLGMEGIISKRTDSFYEAFRTRDWLKIKCTKRQEMVVGGWSDPEGSRTFFGSLLLGYYDDDGSFIYAGRMGTGFNEATRRDLFKRMKALAADEPAFKSVPRGKTSDAHWVKPELVVEVNFAEWTDEGILRQPSFQGLREDKPARDVTREKTMRLSKPAEQKKQSDAKKTPRKKSAKSEPGNSVDGITITHPERMLFPHRKITKLQLAQYFHEVQDHIMPHLIDRPLALVRCPEGREKDCFFQKHANPAMAKHVFGVDVGMKEGPHMFIRDIAGLITLAQHGALEVHT
ncbi:MAG: DNA ligase D, partial [Candidatus Sumerlaeota bacterium]